MTKAWSDDGDHEPHVRIVDDPKWAEFTPAQELSAAPTHKELSAAFVADCVSMRSNPFTLLTIPILPREMRARATRSARRTAAYSAPPRRPP
ncbi:DUF6924 domain-containing protein [Streptomyces celluloflavus]|uniref:DUF6924 domain-containing protein n=1 Tax=Streptomyces celluloflavus TaxID=58344 RepID=UPI003680CB23